MLARPYFRIWRGGENTLYGDERFFPYTLDSRYCPERTSLCRAYKILEQDLETLFEYIEPCDANNTTHSHRTFELMLRASTEFEANCKGILLANGYSPLRRNGTPMLSDSWNINDYWMINNAIKLSDYKVVLKAWHPNPLQLEPFRDWHGTTSHQGLGWYQAYNEAKHNRDTRFERSNFENTIKAIAGLLCVLFAQFSIHTTYPYSHAREVELDDDRKLGMQGLGGSMFDIDPPTWTIEESYDFDWKTLKSNPNPYKRYSF